MAYSKKENKFDTSISEHDNFCIENTIPEGDRESVIQAMKIIFEKGGFLSSKGIDIKINFTYPPSTKYIP